MNKRMKRKTGKRKRQLQRKYFFRKLITTGALVIAASAVLFGGVFLYKKIKENANTVSMVADVSGDNSSLNMEQSDSLAAVKAAMARPTSFSPRCVESTKPSLYIESTAIEADGQTLASISDYAPKESHSFDAGISYTDVDWIVKFL